MLPFPDLITPRVQDFQVDGARCRPAPHTPSFAITKKLLISWDFNKHRLADEVDGWFSSDLLLQFSRKPCEAVDRDSSLFTLCHPYRSHDIPICGIFTKRGSTADKENKGNNAADCKPERPTHVGGYFSGEFLRLLAHLWSRLTGAESAGSF